NTPIQWWFGARATPPSDDYPTAWINATHPVDWLDGACLLVRRDAWRDTGGMDPGFFMYWEETDWFRRAATLGWRGRYVGAARVVHYAGKSSEQNIAARHMRFHGSSVRYVRKHMGRLPAWWLAGYLRALFAMALLEEAGKWAVGHKRALRAGRVRDLSRVVARPWPVGPTRAV
ncbi:MAG: hypothetical protein NZ518_11955, partial [Dehalococcoidia bacterium]|nr:hypothetical protein [Dehalococcoidia bacterium]